MGNLSDGGRFTTPVDSNHHHDKWSCLREINGKGVVSSFEDPKDLLFDKLLYLLRFLKLSPFESLTNTLNQLTGCFHTQIGFEKKAFHFVQEVLINRLFSQEELVNLFYKTLMGF